MQQASCLEEIADAVRRQPRLVVAGGGSKPALSGGAKLSLAGLCGVLEYEPGEFTFTALAGTPITHVNQLLAEHGQYLPFDPPLTEAGATLGGTVAAGLSGPGRYRYGGVRDFLLGVRLVTGEGRVVRGGGKVVKNAAGFDLPKLMVGSLGQFGVLVELSFKVFPLPEAWSSLAVDLPALSDALETMASLSTSSLDLAALDLEPPTRLWLRIGGSAEAMPGRLQRIRQFLPRDSAIQEVADEQQFWRNAREFSWIPSGHGLVKAPIAPRQIPQMERELASLPALVPRRYSVGGNVVWLAWPLGLAAGMLESLFQRLGRPGLALTGKWPSPILGPRSGAAFADRLLRALDPDARFQRTPSSAALSR